MSGNLERDGNTFIYSSDVVEFNVVQSTGTSETDVMSQKAVTDEIAAKFDKDNLESTRSQSTTKAPTSKIMDDELKRAEYLIDDNLITDYASCTWVTGKYIGPDGAIGIGGAFSYCSNYIPVVGGQKYTFQSSALAIAWYDANQVFISISGGVQDPVAVRTFTAPNNAAFARVNQPNTIKESFIFYLGENYLLSYLIKKQVIKLSDLADVEFNTSDIKTAQEVQPTVITDYASCTWVTGQYIGTNGTTYSYATFSYCSNYIPVSGGEKYTFQSNGYAIAWYDSNQIFIRLDGLVNDPIAIRTFTAPTNAAFARVNQSNNIKPAFVFYQGLSISLYKITDLIIEKSQIIDYSESGTDDMSITKPTINSVANALDFPAYQITGNVVVSGDSTIAAYAGGTALSAIISCSGTMTNIAVPGHTINQQLSAWNALDAGVRSAVNYVFVQIGLNDLYPAESAQTAIGILQAFINKIKADAPSSVIVTGTMIPCKQRLINLYGATNGLIAFQKWQIMNYFIEKGLVLNVDKVSSEHTYQLADSNWNLDSAFDTGDAIHENTAGRKIIAYSWLSAIK